MLAWTPIEESLWAKTAPPGPDTPPLEGGARTDVAVVGAGYCGLSTALHLARRGVSITVLEAREPGWGASGRNAGHCTPDWTYYLADEVAAKYGPEHGERINDFQAGSGNFLFGLIRDHRIECEAAQSGTICVVRHGNRKALAEALARAEQWGRRGKAVEMLDEAGVAERVGSDRFQAGLLLREGGHIQPLALARGLARAAQAAGATIHGNSPVSGLARDGGAWRLATPGGVLSADTVILATNAHRSNLWPGLDEAYYPVASMLGATPPLPEEVRHRMLPGGHNFAELGGGFFLFIDAGGRLVIGGGVGLGVNNTKTAAEAWLGRRLNGAFPYLGRVTFDHYWRGWLDFSPHRIPGVHELAPGLFAALGFSGRGVPTATAMGREVANMVASGDPDSMAFPLTPLPRARFNRLAQWIAANVLIPWDRVTTRIE